DVHPGQRALLSPVRGPSMSLSRTGSALVMETLGAQRPERRPDLGREQLGLLPGGEVAALVDLVEVGEVGVDFLGPAARGPRWQSRSIPGRSAASSSWRMAAKASSVAAGGSPATVP